ncbi:MAG: helix-turn-helix transcriptional regulator [Gammaproteobacteria bacterium]
MPLLRRFIPFFKEKASKILKQAEKEKIAIFPHAILHREKSGDINKKQFLSAIHVKNYHLPNGIVLTEQEFKCAINLTEGKTAEQISRNLALSKRTIEAYTDRLKRKMGCLSKSDLIASLLKSKIDLYTPVWEN